MILFHAKSIDINQLNNIVGILQLVPCVAVDKLASFVRSSENHMSV